MKHLAALIIAVSMCVDASADMQMTMAEKDLSGGARAAQTQISVRDGKVLFSVSGNGDFSAIYNTADGSLTQIDHASKTYMLMDKKGMQDSMDQMSAMMKQVEEQLANLPKEQREAMMKSMPGLGKSEAKPEPVELDWTGEKREVAGYPCRIALVKKAGAAEGESCIANPGDLGMSKADFEALASMFETMQEYSAGVSGESAMPDMRKIGGFPIATNDPNGGTSSALVSASNDELEGEIFEVQATYKRRTMPEF